MRKKFFWINLFALFFIILSLRAPISIIGPLTETLSHFLNSTQIGLLGSIPPITFGIIAFIVIFLQPIQALFIALLCLIFGILLRSLGAEPSSFLGMFALFGGTFILSSGIAIANVLLPVIVKSRYSRYADLAMSLYTVVAGGSLLCGVLFVLPILQKTSLSFAMGVWVIFPLLGLLFYLPRLYNGRLFRKKQISLQTQNLYKNFTAWNITLFMGFQALLSYSISIWLPQMISEKGFGIKEGTHFLLISQIFAILASLLCPILLSRLSYLQKMYLLLILGGVYAGIPLVLYFSSTYQILLFASILWGIPIGACFSIALLLISWKSKNRQESIKLSSMSQGIGYLMGAFGPYILGKLHTISGNFESGFWVLFFCGIGLCVSGYCGYRGKNI